MEIKPDLNSSNATKWVRVRLFEKQSSLTVKADAIASSKDLKPFQKMTSAPLQSKKVVLESINDKSPYKLKVNDGEKTNLYVQSEIFLFGKNLKIGQTKIPPVIKIKRNQKNLDVIAFIPLETYLAGVIQGEVPKTWSQETLKAQIIAARTYALNLMENKKLDSFDLESTVKDQVFLYSTDKSILKLAQETKNQVLMDNNKQIIKAYYHSDCGGRTSSVKNVFGYSEDRTQVIDPFCQASGRKNWEREVSYDFLKERLGSFSDIKINQLNSERNFQVTIVRDDEDKEIMNAQVFRSRLGYQFLKSTWFELVNVGKSWIFKGKGNGHGVGLCQWGAKVMGDRGYNYKEILKFYYPDTKLRG
jgi:stage II sporulation protein D